MYLPAGRVVLLSGSRIKPKYYDRRTTISYRHQFVSDYDRNHLYSYHSVSLKLSQLCYRQQLSVM